VIELLADTNIKYVRVARNITDKGLIRLGQLCPQLERAYIRPTKRSNDANKYVCTITIDGLIQFIEQCRSLTWLDIGWTDVFDNASDKQVEKLFESLPSNFSHFCMRGTGFRWLDLRVDLISKLFTTNLVEINLGKTKITRKHIIQILSSCTNLQRLIIDRLPFGDSDLEEFLNVSGQNLTLLDLGDTLCSDRALMVIADKCPNMEYLVLRNLPIGDTGLIAISKLEKLRSLDVGGCYEITDAGISELAKLTTLEEINLESLHQVTEESVKKLINACKKLQKLEIPETAQISRAFRTAMINGREWRQSITNIVYYF